MKRERGSAQPSVRAVRWERWWRQVPGGSQPRTANNGNETAYGMFPICASSAKIERSIQVISS